MWYQGLELNWFIDLCGFVFCHSGEQLHREQNSLIEWNISRAVGYLSHILLVIASEGPHNSYPPLGKGRRGMFVKVLFASVFVGRKKEEVGEENFHGKGFSINSAKLTQSFYLITVKVHARSKDSPTVGLSPHWVCNSHGSLHIIIAHTLFLCAGSLSGSQSAEMSTATLSTLFIHNVVSVD